MQSKSLNFKSGLSPYWNSFCLVAGATFLGGLIEPYIGYRSIGFLFLICTLLVGLVGTLRPALFAATISAFAWNFFFIPPRFTFHIEQPEDLFLCLAFFVTAAVTGLLATRVKTNDQTLVQRNTRITSLYRVLGFIASKETTPEMLNKIGLSTDQALGGHTGFLLCDTQGQLDFMPKPYNALILSTLDREAAQNAFSQASPASVPQALFVPLVSNASKVEGLLVFNSPTLQTTKTDSMNFLEAFAQPLALVLEKRGRLEQLEAASYREALFAGSLPQVRAIDAIKTIETTASTQRKLSLTAKVESTTVLDLVTLMLQESLDTLSGRHVSVELPKHLPPLFIDKELFAHALAAVLTDIVGTSGASLRAVVRQKNILLIIETEDRSLAVPSGEILASQGAALKTEERAEGGLRAVITLPAAPTAPARPDVELR